MGRPRITRLSITCPVCGNQFGARQSRRRKYCSRKCAGQATASNYAAKRVWHNCKACGKPFETIPSRKRAQFCCFLCKQGYIARATIEERANKLRYTGKGKGYVKYGGRHLHRVLAERMLNRPLRPGEVVHHKDGNVRNNAPENLVVMQNQGEHAALHSRKDRKCCIPNCGRKHAAKGFCQKHWRRWRRGQEVEPNLRAVLQEIQAGKMKP